MDHGLGQNGFDGLAGASALPKTLTPALSHPPVGERGTDPLELVAAGDMSLADIAHASGMSILELAAHICTPRNLEALARVAQLHAIEQEMMLVKLKRKALGRLAELTDEVAASSADEIRASEVMRKACVDLLRYGAPGGSPDNLRTRNPSPPPGGPGGSGGGGPRACGYHPDSITPAFEAEVLEALEKLGEEREEEEVYPQITQITQIEDSPGRIGLGGCKSESKSSYEPRTQVSGSSLLPRASGSIPPDSPPPELATRTGGTPEPPLENKETRTGGPPVPLSREELATRAGSPGIPGIPGMPGPPAPPQDGSIGHGQSRHCPGCPGGGHEGHAVPETKHGIVGLDHAHPP